MQASKPKTSIYGLVDGAQYHDALSVWIETSPTEARYLFDGFTEEKIREAGPILFEIPHLQSDWVQQVDLMDSYLPCFTIIESTASLYALAAHLCGFLFVDIGDGMQALLRWFDPRALPSILKVAGAPFQALITEPMTSWRYRDGHGQWREIAMEVLKNRPDPLPERIILTQQQVDQLEALDEPHGLLSELIEIGLVDGESLFAERFTKFERCYLQVLQWKLPTRADRKVFCAAWYQYGEKFDQHQEVKQAIKRAQAGELSLDGQLRSLPSHVWAVLRKEMPIKNRV